MTTRPEDQRKWHLEKNVSVGHIITTLSVAVSMMIWATTVEKRVSLLEAAVPVLVKADERNDVARAESLALIRDDLKAIREKLDRLAEHAR